MVSTAKVQDDNVMVGDDPVATRVVGSGAVGAGCNDRLKGQFRCPLHGEELADSLLDLSFAHPRMNERQDFYRHFIRTFSHAAGTVRMGEDPRTAPLDEWCAFRGVENVSVVDASVMPTSGGVNPSLTIAANALRVGEHLAGA